MPPSHLESLHAFTCRSTRPVTWLPPLNSALEKRHCARIESHQFVAHRAMSLFCNYDLVISGWPSKIVHGTVNQQDRVRVVLQRPAFLHRELVGALILVPIFRPAQLANRQDRDARVFCQRANLAGDLGYPLALVRRVCGNKLHVVDDDKAELLWRISNRAPATSFWSDSEPSSATKSGHEPTVAMARRT